MRPVAANTVAALPLLYNAAQGRRHAFDGGEQFRER